MDMPNLRTDVYVDHSWDVAVARALHVSRVVQSCMRMRKRLFNV